MTDSHLVVPSPEPRTEIHIAMPLASRQLQLSEALHVHPIRVRLSGDAVVAMDCFDADVPHIWSGINNNQFSPKTQVQFLQTLFL